MAKDETYDEQVARTGGFPAPYVPDEDAPAQPYEAALNEHLKAVKKDGGANPQVINPASTTNVADS